MLDTLRQQRFVRFAAVFTVLMAWFVVSNRCVLGAFIQPHDTAHHCCGDSAPAGKTPEEEPMLCCKALAVTMPDSAKIPVSQISLLKVAFVILDLPELAVLENDSSHFGTGPPYDAPAFAELVLHRSLRAHAPPVLS